jgi:hypothetical protein
MENEILSENFSLEEFPGDKEIHPPEKKKEEPSHEEFIDDKPEFEEGERKRREE